MNKLYRLTALVLLSLILCGAAYSQSPLKTGTALDFYKKGQSFQQEEDWAGAVEQYQEALRLNPTYTDVWVSLSECAYSMSEYALALTYIDTALKYLKDSSTLQNLKGFSLIGLGRLEEAKSIFLSVLASFPNDVDARFGLAELDLFNGRISGAEKYYKDALSRQVQNKKALLSLALISYELGNKTASKDYLSQALLYHNGESEVHYFASYVAVMDGNLSEAENHCRNAVLLSPKNDKFLELLSLILYNRSKYNEAMEICDKRIALNRNTSLAWYVKAKIFEKQGKPEDALRSYETGLEIQSADEVMRTSMENLITSALNIEDTRRSTWAQPHIKKAKEAMASFLSDRASYEYKRALRLNPLDASSRLLYADLLLQEKKMEAYVSQLTFIKSQGNTIQKVEDTIESYSSLLKNTLPSVWGIDPFYLDKTRYSLGLYYTSAQVQLLHPDSVQVTAQLLKETFESQGFLRTSVISSPVAGYAEAFRFARTASLDFFALVDFDETQRDVAISLQLYSAKTGSSVGTVSVYRTGNGRYSLAVQKVVSSVTALFPVKGTILERSGSKVLVDIGKNDGVVQDAVYTIIKSGELVFEPSSIALTFNPSAVLGTLTITTVGEDISEGKVKQQGFYDRINEGDELIPAVTAEEKKDAEPQSTPEQIQTPLLIEMLQLIR